MTANDTYHLAKAFYNIANAKKYFEAIKGNPKVNPSTRHKLNAWANKIKWVEDDLITSISPANADIFKAEIRTWETLVFDSVIDKLVLMEPEAREKVEDYCDNLLKNSNENNHY